MTHTILIEQGDRGLQDVDKATPKTRINQNNPAKFPRDVYDGTLINSRVADTWKEEDTTFIDPHAYDDGGGDSPANALQNEDSIDLTDENGNVLEAN